MSLEKITDVQYEDGVFFFSVSGERVVIPEDVSVASMRSVNMFLDCVVEIEEYIQNNGYSPQQKEVLSDSCKHVYSCVMKERKLWGGW